MADTRCANPAYSLEVDTMMLEYTLYKAIEAHLQLLKEISTASDLANINPDEFAAFQASPASALTETYDTLTLLFKHNHPGETLKTSTQFDVRILQFLTLLRIWLLRRVGTQNESYHQISPGMQRSLLNDSIIHQTYRRLWRHYRTVPLSPPDSLPADPWNLQIHASPVNLADHVVPRFMEISEEFASVFQGLSEKWMHLTAHLLTQSAIEVLSSKPDNQAFGPATDTTTSNIQQALETCFAWGHVERRPFTESFHDVFPPQLQSNFTCYNISTSTQHELLQRANQQAEFEDRLWEMFFDQGSKSTLSTSTSSQQPTPNGIENATSNSIAQSSGELRSWTKIRQDALEDVLLTYTSMLEAGEDHRERPLQILREQYPLSNLLAELTDFISKHSAALHNREWNGKPVLVQIEEGGLEGVDEEFEIFKERAGIAGMP